ncbi:MAG TPA: cupin domain-containing protein [Candidatus Dormibacteraeota bacterium]|nr:cupin domain-containing protein [Candidatus Dormibacteraeota bacterium]
MDAFEVADLIAARERPEHVYADFIRSDLLSVGLATWPAGTADTQQPHTEDEVYYVVQGRARMTVAGERRPVGPGSIVYVATGVEHRFTDIEEDLHVLVFWAPPYRSQQKPPAAE